MAETFLTHKRKNDEKTTLLALASALSMVTAQAQEAKVECAADDAKCIEAAKSAEGKCGEGKCGGTATPVVPPVKK